MNADLRSSRDERHERVVVLTARDKKIIFTVGRFTLASTRHLTLLFFEKKNTANKRLRALFNGGYLRAHLLLGSTSPTIYTLAPTGQRLLVGQLGVDRSLIRVPKTLDVADLHHRLAIVDVRVAFILATRERSDLRLVRFLTGSEVIAEMKDTGADLVPDALVLVERSSAREVYACEVDLATEPIAIWKKKIDIYSRLILADTSLLGDRAWRVLVAAPGPGRLRSIANAIGDSDRRDRFAFVDLDDLVPATIADGAWITASALATLKAPSSSRRNANG